MPEQATQRPESMTTLQWRLLLTARRHNRRSAASTEQWRRQEQEGGAHAMALSYSEARPCIFWSWLRRAGVRPSSSFCLAANAESASFRALQQQLGMSALPAQWRWPCLASGSAGGVGSSRECCCCCSEPAESCRGTLHLCCQGIKAMHGAVKPAQASVEQHT